MIADALAPWVTRPSAAMLWTIYGEQVFVLNHWGWVTHICISKLNIFGSDNDLLPGRHQAIIWTNAGIFLIGPSVTNFNEILIEIPTFLIKELHLKMLSGKWRPFCLGHNVLSKERYQLLALSLCWEITGNANVVLCFQKQIQQVQD